MLFNRLEVNQYRGSVFRSIGVMKSLIKCGKLCTSRVWFTPYRGRGNLAEVLKDWKPVGVELSDKELMQLLGRNP